MTALGEDMKSRIRESFHGFTNRSDRSLQATMGPSEAGHPCDRRIGLTLAGMPRCNPGMENWASFVGTQVHLGLEGMSQWADAGSGRYATELRVSLPSKYVPGGTLDLLDRQLKAVIDWKVMGRWSLDKLKTEGPNPTYRAQAHLYALGATLAGEEVEHVAIVGMPRENSSLDGMYVWTERYDPARARAALGRVERIGATLDTDPMALEMDNSDCRFCPFYMPGIGGSVDGKCNGRN